MVPSVALARFALRFSEAGWLAPFLWFTLHSTARSVHAVLSMVRLTGILKALTQGLVRFLWMVLKQLRLAFFTWFSPECWLASRIGSQHIMAHTKPLVLNFVVDHIRIVVLNRFVARLPVSVLMFDGLSYWSGSRILNGSLHRVVLNRFVARLA